MKTINEIRARIKQHENARKILEHSHDPTSWEQRRADDSQMHSEAYEIAVKLLAEVDRLEDLLHVVEGARDVLMAENNVLKGNQND